MLSRIPPRVSLWIPFKDFPQFLSLFFLPLPQEIFPCKSFSYKFSTNFLQEISPKISPVLPSINCRELSFLTGFPSEFLPEPLSVDKFRLVMECLSGCFWIYPGHSLKIYSGVLLRMSAEAIAYISNGVLPGDSFQSFFHTSLHSSLQNLWKQILLRLFFTDFFRIIPRALLRIPTANCPEIVDVLFGFFSEVVLGMFPEITYEILKIKILY